MKKAMIYFKYFLSLSIISSLNAQSFKGSASYDIKLAEDVFYFEGTLDFTSQESSFTFKKYEKSKWTRENEQEFKSQTIFTDSLGFAVYHEINKNDLTIRAFCKEANPIIYKDSVNFNWKLLNSEESIIQGVACKKAFVNFRGREYVAWYASSIPLNIGPWKFFGLPGLILQVTDKKGDVSILIKSLNFEKINSKIKKELVGMSMSKKEFNDCLDKEWIKYYNKNNAAIVRIQAEFPDLEITNNNLSKERSSTEIDYKN
ncbi:MAG: hypothetical protein COZ76_11000 [Flavobacteriales bacterium CG_4_8_14_3_um_filter_35_10]|nr:MAG: hypothetical protein COZ76_11000 [Flavobacteriales bacterium CG_4_8_14_3_um_filter_35_10]PJA05813.1 MAG: hypothetical protein COX71_04815 [Flavobacteriales bacterium CG_4_10_14_0_2_um_filter_35_18]